MSPAGPDPHTWNVQIDSRDPWWTTAVCYQVYVRSFADSNGDGVGDLAGSAAAALPRRPRGRRGVAHAVLPLPEHDHGYDVADYRDVDPLFGTLADFDALLARAHALGIRVIVDVVPNHSSTEHPGSQGARRRPRPPPATAHLP